MKTIDSFGDAGDFNSIATDSRNKVHISYYERNSRNLMYATNKSGSWVKKIIDYVGGEYTSIAVDKSDKVHISYYDKFNRDLRYITNAPRTSVSGN